MELPVSVVVITKNEEKRLKDCLESVRGWASEIILVDDESTDKTREIARLYTDKVFVRRMDNEGRHRNWANSQAKCDWVLSLDADERVTGELKEEIAAALKNNYHDYPGFTIPRKNFLGNYWLRWGGLYPAPQLKLFLKDRLLWEEVEVHPRAFMEGDCGRLNNPLLHYTYADFADFLRKLNNQTNLEAKKWLDVYKINPKKANYKMNFIHALWRAQDRFFRAYLSKKGWRDGFIGFMISFFSALYQMIAYAKYWEMKKKLMEQGKS
ncbi:MAG: glycosyltransferase family 2 protein [Candidatus Omnitrophica bacterium]|nr:glycosyltransferase family 2 protein [Candidatus Omnitrophota bacterium]